MLFDALATSLPACIALLCALHYADYALTVLGFRLYVTHGRQHMVFASYELNPKWRAAVTERRYWNKRLLFTLPLMTVLALLVWLMGVVGSQTGGSDELWRPVRDGVLAALISTQLMLISAHLRNIVIFRLMASGGVVGQMHQDESYTFAAARWQYALAAVPLVLLAALQPSAVTVGFACGPLLLTWALFKMQRRRTPGMH